MDLPGEGVDMLEIFCSYCQRFRLDGPFKIMRHWRTGSQRKMCKGCQDTRKKPRSELVELAKATRLERTKK